PGRGRTGHGTGRHGRPVPGPGSTGGAVLDDGVGSRRGRPRPGLRAVPQPAQRGPVARPGAGRARVLAVAAARDPPVGERTAGPGGVRGAVLAGPRLEPLTTAPGAPAAASGGSTRQRGVSAGGPRWPR